MQEEHGHGNEYIYIYVKTRGGNFPSCRRNRPHLIHRGVRCGTWVLSYLRYVSSDVFRSVVAGISF